MFHDAAEIITGDLPTPVKYFNSEIRAAYQEVENMRRTGPFHAAGRTCGQYTNLCFPLVRKNKKFCIW